MPRHLLDEVTDAMPPRPRRRALRGPVNAAEDPTGRHVPPVAVQGWKAIPTGCSCTWRPDYGTMRATWTLAGVLTTCKVHGDEDGDKT